MKKLLNRLFAQQSTVRLAKSKVPNRKSNNVFFSRHPRFESLENRSLLAGDIHVSIGDATIGELGGFAEFVSSGDGGLQDPTSMATGPDGNLYVTSRANSRVLRYDDQTGNFLGTFVQSGSGGLALGNGLAFTPDGSLLVASAETDQILRYNGSTGAFLNVFVSASAGLQMPGMLLYGTDGNLYVSDFEADSVVRFNGTTGALIDTFVTSGSGGLDAPRDMAFGPDGNLYVAGRASGNILRYDGDTGAFIDEFVPRGTAGLDDPWAVNFGPDGYLYVSRVNASRVARFDASTGAFAGELMGDVRSPTSILFANNGSLLTTNRFTDEIVRYSADVEVNLSEPATVAVSVDYSTSAVTAASGVDFAAQSGTLTFQPGETSRRIFLQPLDDLQGEPAEVLTVELANPSAGAVIGDGLASITVIDDESARLITISDAAAIEGDTTPHYRGPFINDNPNGQFCPYTYGPDGNFYAGVCAGVGPNTVRRYSPTGEFLDTVAPAGHINGPRDIGFLGNYMYVGSEYTDEVLRFDWTTGTFVDVFVSAGSGGIGGPHGLIFGPDANGDNVPELYVTGRDTQNLVRYDGATGQPLGTMNTAGSGALSLPESLTSDANGVLYVASTGNSRVQKYDAVTGAYLGAITNPALIGPKGIKFGPDGLLYVTSSANDRILKFTASGTYMGDYVPAGSGGLDDPYRLTFGPNGNLYTTSLRTSHVLEFGTQPEAIFTISISTPSTLPIDVHFSTADGTAIASSDYALTSSTIRFVPGSTEATIRVPLLDDGSVEAAETFTVNLTNPVGGVIVDSTGVGTIIDNELPPTKFYVVDDGSSNKTFEYAAAGSAIENYNLNSSNSAPRGAASTATGDNVWVVDANRNVYVYSPSGTLLGSWSVGGFNNSAQLEGIAVSGNDIWIVDNKSDKIYRYTNAASRLSGSQNAASSFALNSGNKDASDLVTDGTSVWVLNNTSSTDKVYKYTVSGSLHGSWTINAGGGSPTGLTIDPSGVSSSIWIVDSSSDRVYEFANARGRTSGSQSPAGNFVLASGNANPQGIADPPVGSGEGSGFGVQVAEEQGLWGRNSGHSPRQGAHESALLSIVGELEQMLAGSKKRK